MNKTNLPIKSGVDIKSADKLLILYLQLPKKTEKNFNNIGGFGSISNTQNIKSPKIIACTDGVGTKLNAKSLNKYIIIDLVAMSK